jgi:hypothetical protein
MIIFKKSNPFIALISAFALLSFFSSNGNNAIVSQHKSLQIKTEDSLLLSEITNLNKSRFIGQTVESFLQNKIIGKFTKFIFVDEPPGVLQYLNLIYSKKISIEIVVKEYIHVKRFTEKRTWKLESFKKEKISKIKVVYDNNTVEIIDTTSK